MAKAPKEKEVVEQQAPTITPAPQQEEGIIARKPPPRPPIPAGNHFARCFRMILIGTVDELFKGETKHLKKVRIGFELPTELRVWKEGEEEKPSVIDVEYTLSLATKANLRKDLDSWRGKAFTEAEADAFDITKLLGKSCMLNIIHKAGEGKNAGKVFEKIAGITPIPKGMPSYDQVNDSVLFNYASKFSQEYVESLPDFIKNKIKSSDEWKAKVQEGIVAKSSTPDAPVMDESHPDWEEPQF